MLLTHRDHSLPLNGEAALIRGETLPEDVSLEPERQAPHGLGRAP